MSTILSGPMFEPAKWGVWESVHKKEGGHYNNYGCRDEDGMQGLREFFKEGEADEFNLCLFSTSGIHGMYTTIEEAEVKWKKPEPDEDGKTWPPSVTFLIVQPRICTVRHGNCLPQTQDDFDFLKKLRASSWAEFLKIGASDNG
jgi:hypothetical protein